MTLERMREAIRPLSLKIGRVLAKISPNPNMYTFLGLGLAWLAPLLAFYNYDLYSIIIIIISAIIDMLDGAVARVTGRASRRGEFLDSIADRLSDTAYFLALALSGLDASLIVLALGLSISISYARAKGELVGIRMRGIGLMERGDRIIWIILLYILLLAGYPLVTNIVLYIGIILLAATLLMRIWKIWVELDKIDEL